VDSEDKRKTRRIRADSVTVDTEAALSEVQATSTAGCRRAVLFESASGSATASAVHLMTRRLGALARLAAVKATLLRGVSLDGVEEISG
jgi:hypothetical protein